MSKKIILCVLFLLFGAFSLVAQTEEKQWEYLVIFDDGTNDINDLGRKNWELIGIAPSGINDGYTTGPARFIFKRQYNFERNKYETELKKKNEGQSNQPQVEFVNLDVVEKQSAQKVNEEKVKAKLAQAIKQVKGFSILSFKPYAWFPNANDKRAGGEIVIDGSKELLKDGNKYRSSEVDEFIRRTANEIYEAFGLKPKYANQPPFTPYFQVNAPGVNIRLSVVVIYNGVTKTLAEGAVQGDWEDTQTPIAAAGVEK